MKVFYSLIIGLFLYNAVEAQCPTTVPISRNACSGTAFSFSASNLGFQAATTFTWNAPTGTGFTGGVSNAVASSSVTGNLTLTGAQTTATYIVIASCTADTFLLRVTLAPTSVGGSAVATASSLCSGATTTITLSGSTGTIQWQQSADGSSGWANVTGGSGATTATYTTPALTSSTFYRAVVTSGTCASANSSTASVTVSPTTVGGTATAAAAAICSNTSTTISVAGNTGTIQWQQSANGTSGWANVSGGSGATSATYTTPNLTSTTYYRAVITSGSCPSANSTTASITISPVSVGGTATAAAASICPGTTTTITVAGFTGTIQWQQSANGSTGWASVVGGSGATSATYTTPTLSATTYYRAVITSGTCASANSTTASVTMIPSSVGGTATATPATVCTGSSSSITLTGYTGTIQWQQSANGTTGWANVTGGSGATAATYSTPALTSTTYYRAVVTSGGSCPSSNSTVASVTVRSTPTLTSVSSTSICSSTQSTITLNGLLPNQTFTVTYSIGANTGLTASVATPSSTTSATFLTSGAVSIANGSVLTINSIAYSDNNPGCSHTFSSNNTTTISVRPTPTLSGVSASSICSGGSSTITLSGLLASQTFTVTYTIGGGSPQTATVTANASGVGTYTVTSSASTNQIVTIVSIAYNTSPFCSQSFGTTTTLVISQSTSFSIPDFPSICKGETTAGFIFSPAISSPVNISIQWQTPPSGVVNPTVLTNFQGSTANVGVSSNAAAGNYGISSISVTNIQTGCVSTQSYNPTTSYLEIKPIPVIQALASSTVCEGEIVSATSIQLATAISGSVSGSWSVDQTGIGLSPASGLINTLPFSIGSFTSANSGTSNLTANIQATVVVNGCSSVSNVVVKQIVVKPKPFISLTPASSFSICDTSSTINDIPGAITITTDIPGTLYSWTNSNTTTGVPSGNANQTIASISTNLLSAASWNPLNTTNAVNTSLLTITSTYNGCAGNTITDYPINVNPTPVPQNLTLNPICSGTSLGPVAFSTNLAGSMTYQWSVAWTSGAPISYPTGPSTGSIPSTTYTNTTNTNLTGLVSVSATSVSSTCKSRIRSVGSISVRPQLDIVVTYDGEINPSVISICNGNTVPTGTISFSSPIDNSISENIVFNWTKDLTTISSPVLPAPGPTSGASLPTFVAALVGDPTLAEQSTFDVNATFTIDGTSTVCSSPISQQQFIIQVNPGPRLTVADSTLNAQLCDGAPFNQLNLGTLIEPSNSSVTWICDNASIDGAGGIGIDSVHSNTIPSFTGNNPVPNTGTISGVFTVVLSSTGTACKSTFDFIVDINPKPVLLQPSTDIKLCNENDTLTLVSNIAGGIQYNATKTGNWGTQIVNGNLLYLDPNIGSSSTVSGTTTITPTVISTGCSGAPTTLNVVVNSVPVNPQIITEETTFCANTSFQPFISQTGILASDSTGYEWNLNPSSVGNILPDNHFSNILIDFNNSASQTATLTLKTTNKATNCYSDTSIVLTFSGDALDLTGDIVEASVGGVIENLIFFKDPALQIDSYQWGYDDFTTMLSYEIASATNQILTMQQVGNANGGLNSMVNELFTNGANQINRYNFWVRISNGQCHTKVYYLTEGKTFPDFPLSIQNSTSTFSTAGDIGIIVFPNPTNGLINISSLKSKNEKISLTVFSSTGQLIQQKTEWISAQKSNILDLTNIESGLYFIRLSDDQGNNQVVKLIKAN